MLKTKSILILCILVFLIGCQSPGTGTGNQNVSEGRKSWGLPRAMPLLSIEKEIISIVGNSAVWEMAPFRSYRQMDMDGDGIDDGFLLTTFEEWNMWTRTMLICFSSQPNRVIKLPLGRKGSWLAESFEVDQDMILVSGLSYAPGDAPCCPTVPSQKLFKWMDGAFIEQLQTFK